MLKTIVTILFVCSSGFLVRAEQKQEWKLWYKQPARQWMEATPLGHGRLGAMIFGGIKTEKIALNEITLWSGQPDPHQEIACGKEKLAEIRRLFFEGKWIEGNQMAGRYLAGYPNSFGTHLPVGDLNLKFHHDTSRISDYHRQLDLTNALTTVTYKVGTTRFKREYFSSHPADVLVIRLSADRKGAVGFDLDLGLLHEALVDTTPDELLFNGQVSFPKFGPGGVRFTGKIKVVTDGGRIISQNNSLSITQADAVTIFIDIRTDFNNPEYISQCSQSIHKASIQKYKQLKQAHIQDYNSLFNRVELCLGTSEADKLPTDERWQRLKAGKTDVGLEALFFHYGRYLIISSSREDSPLPANLQGLWNDNLACNMPWTCDYHLDVNTQQNYWLTNIANLAECNAPLFNYIGALSVAGEKTAEKVYGCPGWVAHTVANIWGYTAPGSSVNWGLFPTASTWIGSHLWHHYLFTQDKAFLKEQGYPLLKKNALFFLHYLVEDPHTGYLMTGPSTSPENSFRYQGWELALSMMPTCDRVLVYELFDACIQSAEVLGIDQDFRDSLKLAIQKLPPLKIGKNGEVQEWFEDVENAHPNHRCATHLLSLYPFAQISLQHTPELAEAAKKVIDNRLSAPDWEDVEFSRANMISYYARLKEPEEAYHSLSVLLRKLIQKNLFTISAAGIGGAECDIYIFDGNQAAPAGIAEMLLQSHEGYVEFIPALPKAWPDGHFKGLCIRGGGEADLEWQNSEIRKACLTARSDREFKIKLPGDPQQWRLKKNGKTIKNVLIDKDRVFPILLKKNDRLEIEKI